MGSFTDNLIKKKDEAAWQPFTRGSCGDAFGKTVTLVNNIYQVSVHFKTEGVWEGPIHLAIVRRDRSPVHDWRHLQRIKNEIAGPEREAIEIYPAESRLVDTNNQFHLWVFPEGQVVPTGFTERQVTNKTCGAHKQRPLPEGTDFTPEPDWPFTEVIFPTLDQDQLVISTVSRIEEK